MRKIEMLADLRVRFPERDAEFDEGVEVGIVATLMALGERNIRSAFLRGVWSSCVRWRSTFAIA
jgi:hypothetical protein